MKKQTKKVLINEFLRWAVYAEVETKNDGVIKKFDRLIAVFVFPCEAEEFIKNCLPTENIKRFKVVDLYD